jgi:predicted GNAT family acetyltransferase
VSSAAGLDNPAYAALTGPQSHLARRSGRAVRFLDDVSPFLAFPAAATEQDWHDAEQLVAPGTGAGVIDDAEMLPGGWSSPMRFDAVQMIGVRTHGAPEPEAVQLAAHDVPEMLDLVARTQPGPFLPRTIEMGSYLGIRTRGELVAMAGERLHLDGWTEVSAICTAPEHRGHGYASRLTRAVIAGIEARGERPFLHAVRTNTTAIRLYERLGFELRREIAIVVVAREDRASLSLTPDPGRAPRPFPRSRRP